MKLENKKALASRALGVGKGKIVFNINRLGEIKEAITKQDIKDLYSDGAIIVKESKGRKAVERRHNRRRFGKVRKKVVDKKGKYMLITRRLRRFLRQARAKAEVNEENYEKLRKEIKASMFKNIVHFKERIKELR